MESLTLTPEPFALTSPFGGSAQRTRVMVFAMNLDLQSGESVSAVSADAEDAAHRHYPLTVESIRPVPSYEWLSAVVLRLNDDLGDVGDVLVGLSYQTLASNRVRIAISHVGGGPADDVGATPTPGLQYTISGRVIGSGHGLNGYDVSLSGPQSATRKSDANGFFSFKVNRIGQYTLTAAANEYYFFTPQIFAGVGQDQTVDVPGTLRNYTVSGWVQLGPNLDPGQVLSITGSQTTSVTTDANGYYQISLPAGGNYVITTSQTYYTFSPASHIVTDLTSDQINRFFVGARQVYSIEGHVRNRAGNALSGMSLDLAGAPELRTSITDSAGRYQFDLEAGYNYSITPRSTSIYLFQPHDFIDLRGNQVFDFIGLRRLQLQGTVRDNAGNSLIGVRVTSTGTDNNSTTTAADGSYSLPATETGNYSLTPSIGQDWYSFSPATGQLTNIQSSQVTDFVGTLAPVPTTPNVLEYDGNPETVDYGNFWQEGTNLGHFYWEFWAMPGPDAGATYVLSDGYGGAHALLFGVGSFNTSEPARYELLGDIFDGVKFDNYFGSDVGPAIGEWAHIAVGWDGENIITYYNGVPVGKTPFHGPRRTPGPGGGGGRLLIGGSDHSNFQGRIAQVRGFEDANPRETSPGGVESSFAPQTVFGLGGSLLSYYFRSGSRVADLSHGYNGTAHEGIPRGTTAGILFDCGGCPPPRFVVDPTAPNFSTGAPPQPVGVPTPPSPPDQALVFDSFSRRNSTYVFGGNGGLGSTESGSTGPQLWQTNQTSGPQPFGVLNARAVLLANSTAVAWVPTGSPDGNVYVRVNRYKGRWGSGTQTGLSFRVADAANFFFAYTADSASGPQSKVLHVGYYQNGTRFDLVTDASIPATWSTLGVVTLSSGELDVYIDNSLVYQVNNPVLTTAAGAGLYNDSAGNALAYRWDNFTVFEHAAPGVAPSGLARRMPRNLRNH